MTDDADRVQEALNRTAHSGDKSGRFKRRQPKLRLTSYQEVVSLNAIPFEQIKPVFQSLLEYFGLEIICEKTPDYVAYEVRPRGPELGPMATIALRRPPNFYTLSNTEKWDVDRELGIIDWDGSPDK